MDKNYVAIGCVLALAGGVASAMKPELVAGLVAVIVLMMVTAMRPHIGIAFWLVFTIFVPSWTLIPVAGTNISTSYIAIPVVLAVLARLIFDRLNGGPRLAPTLVDSGVMLGVLLVVSYQYSFDQAQFLATNVVIALFGGYILGRLANVSAQKVFVVAMVIVAIWGIAEFLLDWHAFVDWQTEELGIGPALQERGGFTRSEASLGHAIAYGAALASALPFTRVFKRPLVLQLILAAGIFVSFSRGPMLALIATFALMLYIERSSSRRIASIAILAVGLVVTYYVFDFLYSGSGQSEVASSSQQRDRQINQSLDFINLFGPADGAQLNRDGRYVTNGVDIVDSVPIRLGLDFGWVTCALLLVPVVVAAARVLGRRVGPAGIAVAGQIPVLLVTSFITQWQILFFFLCGIAVTEFANARAAKRSKGTPSAGEPSKDKWTTTTAPRTSKTVSTPMIRR